MYEVESNSDRIKTLSVEGYPNNIRPYLKDTIDNLKNSDARQIQSIMTNNFNSSIDNNEKCVMHSKSYNIKIMINDEPDEVIK